jgi:amino acid adenylation domain-containing protein
VRMSPPGRGGGFNLFEKTDMNMPLYSINLTAKGVTAASPPRVRSGEQSVAGWVALQASIRPEAPAVSSSHAALNYRELDLRAGELAGVLSGLGVGPETVVGLLVPRSPALAVGALGILKAGGAYLPLDPSYPQARLDFMLEDARAPVLIAGESVRAQRSPAAGALIVLDERGRLVEAPVGSRREGPEPVVSPGNLAYVIYTSGSTGQPKGVEVTHASLLNLVQWHQHAFQVTEKDRASQVARVGFDAAVWEVWPYLTAGASLDAPDEALLSEPEALRDWLVAEGITIGFVPTPMAERLLALPWPAGAALRVMLTGGDTLHTGAPSDVPFLLVNNYGPTECTVVATSALVSQQGLADRLPPIGFPIRNTRLYVLDESRNQVAAGDSGELYIGGAGVARGYRNRAELTAERFVPDPFSGEPGARLFRTGDRVRYLPDGQLAFLGRIDDQIKIRGFRIEPNEVAAALNEHPAILQSAVAPRETSPGDRRLVGYFVPRAGLRPALTGLREFLCARLPEFMVPAAFVALERLPLTPNGKVDRGALPPPDLANTLRDGELVAPRTEVERTVAGLLAPLLGVDQVDVEANFFTLGGHSLLATQLIARVRQAFGVELALRRVFDAPTVAGISTEIEQLLLARLDSMSDEQAREFLSLISSPQDEGRGQ